MFFPSGQHTVKHCLDIDLFVSIPDSRELYFGGEEDTIYQDFCVAPRQMPITDVAITLIPLDAARPGFNSEYKIIIENLGNLYSSGTVELDIPMDTLQMISSSEAYSLNGDQVTWTYTNLPILGRKTITFTTRTNSSMDVPAITVGEIIKFEVEVIPDMTDANPIDNITTLCQTVVNSHDPNDKRCLQGGVLDESRVGSYIDYMIRFENTGSAEAINITVQDTLDSEVYDIATLRLLDASHSVHVAQKGSAIEFIFNDIYLSHLDSLNDGYVAFKIKTKEDLELGDSITNNAAIYFDFNWPILTNQAITIVGADQDGDGYGFIEDCDDNNPSVYPGAEEVCDGLDNNCNEVIDEGLDLVTYYIDADQDGYGDNSTGREECSQPDGLITTGGDCNDTDPAINPEAEDIVNNGIDEDCDGMDAVSSLDELSDLGISVYPNPVKDLLFIQQKQNDQLSFSLVNVEGKQVFRTDLFQALNTIDLSTITSGVYFMRIMREENVVNARVVVK